MAKYDLVSDLDSLEREVRVPVNGADWLGKRCLNGFVSCEQEGVDASVPRFLECPDLSPLLLFHLQSLADSLGNA